MWARGSCDVVPHFSTVNSWWPLLPYSSAKPFIGTRDVPVANWSSRERISLLNEYTALSTDTDTMYHHHYPVNCHYYRRTWISRFSLGCSSPTSSGSEPLEICERDFYGPDVLPASQPSASKHWREHKALIPTSGLASYFLRSPPDSWWKRHCSIYASSQCQYHNNRYNVM